MGFFIEPSSLPGGSAWLETCAAAAASKHSSDLLAALDCDSATAATSGLLQNLFLLAAYGLILFTASNLISDGSELLLLVPALRAIVGSVVLPILGAVPDGAIILFSGLGENAQEEVAVGVGALAGSTIMLLTVPWFLSVYAGRVNVHANGELNYKRPKGYTGPWTKLNPPGNMSLRKTAVDCPHAVTISGRVLLVTALTYLIIQIPAFFGGSIKAEDHTAKSTAAEARSEHLWAVFGSVVAFAFFVLYLVYQVAKKESGTVKIDEKLEEVTHVAIKDGRLKISTAFFDDLKAAKAQMGPEEGASLKHTPNWKRLEHTLKKFYNEVDSDKSGLIDFPEFQVLMYTLGEKNLSSTELKARFDSVDGDMNGTLNFDEFCTALVKLIGELGHDTTKVSLQRQITAPAGDAPAIEVDEEEEEEDVPEDLKDNDPKKQMSRIMKRSFGMMAMGTALVLIFADPMVDVLSDLGFRLGIPPFYISFVLAPLASNASELIAAFNYAGNKTRRTIAISFSTLIGAGVMNNTFCLGIFLLLVAVKGLAWQFAAETLTILVVEVIMGLMAAKKMHTLGDGLFVLSLFPASLAGIYFLQNVLGFD